MHTASSSVSACTALPEHLAQAVWRGDALGSATQTVISSGHPLLDAELPGGGWPCRSMSEILINQMGQAEWRLLSPALAQLTKLGGSVLLIGAPHVPHLPSLWREGLHEDRLVRIDAQTPAERLWATEQALKARCVCAVLSWLSHARTQEIRRLQACATQHPGLFFVFRPVSAQADSSAAPLRVRLGLAPYPHPLTLEIIKRRGPMLEAPLTLPHWPRGLVSLLPASRPVQSGPVPRMPRPSQPSRTAHAAPTDIALSSPHHHAALDGLAAGHAPRSDSHV
ncbi:MAG: translesion DNA synthesis-associated protein ImuA [Aquabacterium sp.]